MGDEESVQGGWLAPSIRWEGSAPPEHVRNALHSVHTPRTVVVRSTVRPPVIISCVEVGSRMLLFAQAGCDFWVDSESGRVWADVSTAFRGRRDWIDTEMVLALAVVAPGAPVRIEFGRRVVVVTVVEEDLVEPVIEVAHLGTAERVRSLEVAIVLVEVARRGLLANAADIGFERVDMSTGSGAATGPSLSLPCTVSPEDALRRLQRRADRDARQARRAAAPNLMEACSVVRPTPPSCFARLPIEAVDHVGYLAQRGPTAGHPKLHLAVLAAHAQLASMSAEPREIEIADERVHVDAHEHIVSVESIARRLYERILLRRVLYADPQDDRAFRAVYEATKRAHKALLTTRINGASILSRAGYAVEGKPQRGVRWTLAGGPLDTAGLAPARPLPFVLARPLAPPVSDVGADGLVDAAGHLTDLVVSEPKYLEEFGWGRTRTSIDTQRGRKTRVVRWARRCASRNPHGYRHHTTGMFREAEIDVPGAACIVPWVIVDIERDRIEDADAAARNVLCELDFLGADLDSVTAYYTGGRGFHVRIPTGFLGVPVFRDSRDVQHVLATFLSLLSREPFDASVLSPRHYIRAVGSRHERTDLMAVGQSGREFIERDIDLLDTRAQRHYPYRIPDPLAVPCCPPLVAILEEAGRRAGAASRGVPTTGLIAALLPGVVEGEPFYGDLSGRNEAAFRYAAHLVNTRPSMAEVWDEMQEWNRRNRPPLPSAEIASVLISAARYEHLDGVARSLVRGARSGARRARVIRTE